MENLFWIGFAGAIVAGLFAWMQAKKVLAYSEGTEKMQKIAANIRAGANAYLKQQYTRSEERRVGKECRSRWSPYH